VVLPGQACGQPAWPSGGREGRRLRGAPGDRLGAARIAALARAGKEVRCDGRGRAPGVGEGGAAAGGVGGLEGPCRRSSLGVRRQAAVWAGASPRRTGYTIGAAPGTPAKEPPWNGQGRGVSQPRRAGPSPA
jgi:hypothetical protein